MSINEIAILLRELNQLLIYKGLTDDTRLKVETKINKYLDLL